MGGLTRGSGINTFEVATEFARVLGADCYYVAAPIYPPSVESRETLLTHYPGPRLGLTTSFDHIHFAQDPRIRASAKAPERFENVATERGMVAMSVRYIAGK